MLLNLEELRGNFIVTRKVFEWMIYKNVYICVWERERWKEKENEECISWWLVCQDFQDSGKTRNLRIKEFSLKAWEVNLTSKLPWKSELGSVWGQSWISYWYFKELNDPRNIEDKVAPDKPVLSFSPLFYPLADVSVCPINSIMSELFRPYALQLTRPLFMGFFRQEYWKWAVTHLQGIVPVQGLNPHLLSPAMHQGSPSRCLLCTNYVSALGQVLGMPLAAGRMLRQIQCWRRLVQRAETFHYRLYELWKETRVISNLH